MTGVTAGLIPLSFTVPGRVGNRRSGANRQVRTKV
jgi:hypothetical protein